MVKDIEDYEKRNPDVIYERITPELFFLKIENIPAHNPLNIDNHNQHSPQLDQANEIIAKQQKQIDELEKQLALAKEEQPINPKRKNSYLLFIKGLLEQGKYDIENRNIVGKLCTRIDGITDDTIRSIVNEISNLK